MRFGRREAGIGCKRAGGIKLLRMGSEGRGREGQGARMAALVSTFVSSFNKREIPERLANSCESLLTRPCPRLLNEFWWNTDGQCFANCTSYFLLFSIYQIRSPPPPEDFHAKLVEKVKVRLLTCTCYSCLGSASLFATADPLLSLLVACSLAYIRRSISPWLGRNFSSSSKPCLNTLALT